MTTFFTLLISMYTDRFRCILLSDASVNKYSAVASILPFIWEVARGRNTSGSFENTGPSEFSPYLLLQDLVTQLKSD